MLKNKRKKITNIIKEKIRKVLRRDTKRELTEIDTMRSDTSKCFGAK